MKKSVLIAIFTLFTAVLMAQIGTSCEKAKPVGAGLDIDIASAGTYWYTASVYDLPIQVTVTSTDINAEAPSVSVDFSCTGVYEEDLAKAIEEQGEEVPIQMTFNPKKIIDGKAVYTMSIGAKYRERLMQVGITRDVKAYVQVVASAGGHVTVTPDPVSKQCLKGMRKLLLPDVIHVPANDVETAYLLPLCDFHNDSVLFVWNGQESPVTLWVGIDDCGFVPEEGQEHVLTSWTIQPGSELKFTSKQINNIIDDLLHSGVYYAKIVSDEAADFRIERVPEQALEGYRLKKGESVPVRANEDTLYYYPKAWKATRFATTHSSDCRVYFSLTPDIDTADATTYIRFYDMDLDSNQHRYLELSDVEMQDLSKLQSDEQNYIYLHVVSPVATTLSVDDWTPVECALRSRQLRSGEPIVFKSDVSSTEYMYRMRYEDWKNGYLVIEALGITGKKKLITSMMKECTYTKPNSAYCVTETYITLTADAPKAQIDSARVVKWGLLDKDKPTDPDGFYYWVFQHSMMPCSLTFTSIPFIMPTALPSMPEDNQSAEKKVMQGGQLFIIRQGEYYDILGRKRAR